MYMGITRPNQLNIFDIAAKLDVYVEYWDRGSVALDSGDETTIFLDENLSPQSQWLQFGHELCHSKRHAGDQTVLPLDFIKYQEWDAHSFSLHFCVPTFMLERLDLPYDIYKATRLVQKTFNVTAEVAVKRLKQLENRKQEEHALNAIKRKCTERDRILNLWY